MVRYFLCLIIALAALGFAQTEPSTIAQALRFPMGSSLDLSLWEDLPRYEVSLSNDETPTPVSMPGYFSLAWDSSNLYILGVFAQDADTLMAELTADATEWWKADTFEVFVRQESQQPFIHIAANPAGVRFREYLATDAYQTDSLVSDGEWALLLSLPLGDVIADAEKGDVWELKIARGHVALKEFSIWPKGMDFLAEDNFGKLVFVDELLSEDELLALVNP